MIRWVYTVALMRFAGFLRSMWEEAVLLYFVTATPFPYVSVSYSVCCSVLDASAETAKILIGIRKTTIMIAKVPTLNFELPQIVRTAQFGAVHLLKQSMWVFLFYPTVRPCVPISDTKGVSAYT